MWALFPDDDWGNSTQPENGTAVCESHFQQLGSSDEPIQFTELSSHEMFVEADGEQQESDAA